ncbi:MAG: radical SAM protein [Euryarchaeota archaeon]|nr:radical SAM protein [Euryarchaeota archaeon]
MGRRIAFFMDYDRYGREEAPAILQFVQTLRNLGHEVDFMTSEGELLAKLPRGYDVVALSAFSSLELGRILKTAIRVKQADSRVVSVLGGHGVAENASKLILAPGIDAVVEGEAENTFPLMLKHLSRARESTRLPPEQPPARVPDHLDAKAVELLSRNRFCSAIEEEQAEEILGEHFTRRIRHRGREVEIEVPITGVHIKTREGEVLYSGSARDEEVVSRAYRRNRERIGGMTQGELSRYLHAHPTREELEACFGGYPWDIVQAKGWHALSLYIQRGCNWGRCQYCSITTPPGRSISVDRVVALLGEAVEHGIEQVTFDDDQFVQSERYVAELCRGIIRAGLHRRLRFGAMLRVDAIKDAELLALMRRAGFEKLQVGVESLVPEKIAYFGKTLPGREEEYIHRAKELIHNCLGAGVEVGVFIITTRPKRQGALEEVAAELEALLTMLLSLYRAHHRLPTLSFNDMLMAYPGAPLLRRERHKRFFVPVALRNGELLVLEIPYIFELKSVQLANFLSILKEMARRRGLPPEQLNETLEHLEDLIAALKVAAQHLRSELAPCLEYLSSLGEEDRARLARLLGLPSPRIESHLLSGRVSAAELERAVERLGEGEAERLRQLPERLREESLALERRCGEMEHLLYALESDIYMQIRAHLRRVREELRQLERSGGATREALQEYISTSQELLHRYYPYYLARSALQNLIAWLEEYASQKT